MVKAVNPQDQEDRQKISLRSKDFANTYGKMRKEPMGSLTKD